mgnify:FL=1
MKNFLTKIMFLLPDEKDKFNYKGWLRSQNIVKRSLAVWGHSFIGGFVLMIYFYLALFIITGAIYFLSSK